MTTVYTYKEIEVNLSEFDTEDLKEELNSRGITFNDHEINGEKITDLITAIWQKRRFGVSFDQEIDKLIWEGIGKIV